MERTTSLSQSSSGMIITTSSTRLVNMHIDRRQQCSCRVTGYWFCLFWSLREICVWTGVGAGVWGTNDCALGLSLSLLFALFGQLIQLQFCQLVGQVSVCFFLLSLFFLVFHMVHSMIRKHSRGHSISMSRTTLSRCFCMSCGMAFFTITLNRLCGVVGVPGTSCFISLFPLEGMQELGRTFTVL